MLVIIVKKLFVEISHFDFNTIYLFFTQKIIPFL